MQPHNIPQNKTIAEHSLMLVKLELLELAEEIAGNNTTVNNINGSIWNRVEIIDAMLQGAEYEEAANLDHMTENQFNV